METQILDELIGVPDRPIITDVSGQANVLYFGADWTGQKDCFDAFEEAGKYLDSIGGGTMRIPGGRYRFPRSGKQINVRSNVEYVGEGYATHIDCTNAGFVQIGVQAIENSIIDAEDDQVLVPMVFDPVAAVTAGDRVIHFTLPNAAANYTVGNFGFLRATADQTSQHHPAFSEIVKIVEVNLLANTVTLEDALEDGFPTLKMAPIPKRCVADHFRIHNLRVTTEFGHPFFLYATYKSVIHNVFTEGISSMIVNAFTKSEYNDVIAEITWQPSNPARIYSPIEIETGAVRALVQNFTAHVKSVDGSQVAYPDFPMVYTQEWSRRTTVKNCRFIAPGMTLGRGIFSMGVGHHYEDISFSCHKMTDVNWYQGDSGMGALLSVPKVFRNIRAEVTGDVISTFTTAAVNGGYVDNVIMDNVTTQGNCAVAFAMAGAVSNVRLTNVRSKGVVHSYDSNDTKVNVQLVSCSFERFTSDGLDTSIRTALDISGFRRYGKYIKPAITFGNHFIESNEPYNIFSQLKIPANFGIVGGDKVVVDLTCFMYHLTPEDGHVMVRVMGEGLNQVDLPKETDSFLQIHVEALMWAYEEAPTKIKIVGWFDLNGTHYRMHNWLNSDVGIADEIDFIREVDNFVQIEVWGDWSGTGVGNINVIQSRIEYLTNDSQTQF